MTRRLLLTLACLCFATTPLLGQWAYVLTLTEVTVTGTAASVFTASDIQAGNGHPQAVQATCSLSGASIRVTWDGQTPTTSLGQVLTPGQYIFSGTQTLLNLQAIRDDSTNATLNCIIYG